ncbi:menaquinone-dependent protoporphyrinogen IX dehydrogenase [Arsenophonus nasoniae]|uniref:Protoporphyrinogen IX dehydrogenase [quinone] n=1 Tax=Arsenophonus nasoniae TaxID=638 RepID=D2TWR0_9GAMM|nr:menaquinone-dependent protoporphyrinogen IX dehydrogenase [Arsenophonus nasoniae]QBY45162.1 Protoporphyrinogen IX dehydrogenase [menaquinone] [Arsenophonus nasoniae]WGL95919.1 menaquinone-dependent protoporphyrinogen IX dehydrogenase [Arsenophonus nasoniae]WGM01173.1 menaquinone-dependent protoporphyrinogen IX dehydrogenase [Arsenophonus nasoniae]WGM05361.1 menaquinone-dependent protoporphyrinogen IX dehydrogenase [Arsenophonus nasoniae]WGM10368.1 menaquinone-dependent protoporphyrinogen IX
MSYLLLYSGENGQTKKIILKITEYLRKEGKQCDVRDLNMDKNFNLSVYQKVLVGASIRYGHFNPAVLNFAQNHQKELNTMPSAFFGVNLTARKKGKDTPETNVYVRKFLAKTPWRPTITSVFAGALCYPQYNWFDRIMIQFIMKITGGETNINKEIEYTDWQKVEYFAREFNALK